MTFENYNNSCYNGIIYENAPWSPESTLLSDCTLHQIAPYIGRMKTSIASYLIEKYTQPGDMIVDPFCGSGVVPLEAICKSRNVIANDWNPYGYVLTDAKINFPQSSDEATKQLKHVLDLARNKYTEQDLRKTPKWVRSFFHPQTLKEALAFRDACVVSKNNFLLALFLGILHHQRPGFLSYPTSHLVPYLMTKKYPKELYPEMYRYRDLEPRMEAKITRTFRRIPKINVDNSQVNFGDAREFEVNQEISAVITSPPYMNLLDYVRDNRLRIWFLNPKELPSNEIKSANHVNDFKSLLSSVICNLSVNIKDGGYIILLLGDISKKKKNENPVEVVRNIFQTNNGLKKFNLIQEIRDVIPDIRRSRRECKGGKTETALVFQKKAVK